MMNQLIIILTLGLMQPSCGNPQAKKDLNICKCTDNVTPIISFKDKNNNQLIFCGILNKKISDDKYIISGFKLINCNDKKEIIDETIDEVPNFIVTIKSDSLLLANTHFVLNKEWNIESIPATEKTIKFINHQVHISSKRNVFVAPQITKEQQDSLISLCKQLKEKSQAGKVFYPYEETTIFLLFMGAINGNADAKYLLKNLDKLFVLDGAIAETRGEIWIDF